MISWERKSNEFLMPLWKWGVIADLLREAASWRAACVYARVLNWACLLSHSVDPDPAEGVDGLHLMLLKPASLAEKFRQINRLS